MGSRTGALSEWHRNATGTPQPHLNPRLAVRSLPTRYNEYLISSREKVMKRFSTTLIHFLIGSTACLAQPDPPLARIEFQKPFGPVSTTKDSTLVLILITNDSKTDLDESVPSVWCASAFRRTLGKLLEQRPDLKERITVQALPAGYPTHFTGGKAKATPSRVVLAICDANYSLLNVGIGVPEDKDVLDLIENAEENQSLLSLYRNEHSKVVEAIVDRVQGRIDRAYSAIFAPHLEENPPNELASKSDWLEAYQSLATELHEVYIYDVRLRFGLGDVGDRDRIALLEQHREARRDWTEAISPFIVGRNAADALPTIIESIWLQTPIIKTAKSDHRRGACVVQHATRQSDHGPFDRAAGPCSEPALAASQHVRKPGGRDERLESSRSSHVASSVSHYQS